MGGGAGGMTVRGASSTLSWDASTLRAAAMEVVLSDSATVAVGVPVASTESVAATPATVGVPTSSSDESTASSEDTSLTFTEGATNTSDRDWLLVSEMTCSTVNEADAAVWRWRRSVLDVVTEHPELSDVLQMESCKAAATCSAERLVGIVAVSED